MQLSLINGLALAFGAGVFLVTMAAAIVSWQEREPRAARRLFYFGLIAPLPYAFVALVAIPLQTTITLALIIGPIIAGGILFFPFGPKTITADDTPKTRIDERDIMFARARLEPGTERFKEYYRRHPEKKPLDDKFRSRPGLLAKGSKTYNPFYAAATDSGFITVEAFHHILDNEPSDEQTPTDPAAISAFIKAWGKQLGAVSVGITPLQDYHVYSHLGRNEPYGAPIEVEHKYAIALTVEMDKDMMDYSPRMPVSIETAKQYLNAGAIATQLAEFIHLLGYPARAHIDGNYRVVCPLVARDAGLGEVGRMGLLVTPELGPRVRLAAVTTDLELIPDERSRDISVIDFCEKCMKCAENCPSKSISYEPQTVINGAKRWQIKQESCYAYWCYIGSDCGRCMVVCPYSHPNNWLHSIVRFGVKQSPLFRSVAVKMDDLLYDRHPAPAPIEGWLDIGPLTNNDQIEQHLDDSA